MCTVVLWVCAVVSVMLPVMLGVNLVVPLTEAVAWVDVEVHKAHTEADTPPKQEFKATSMMIGPIRVQDLLLGLLLMMLMLLPLLAGILLAPMVLS